MERREPVGPRGAAPRSPPKAAGAGRAGSRRLRLILLAALGALIVPVVAVAKTPGTTYCFRDICHRVKTLEETHRLVGLPIPLVASFYDDCSRDIFNPCGLTSSGETFRPLADDNAASPIYPDGTRLLIWSPLSHIAAVVRINNAGPYMGERTLDVSRGVAERMGFAGRGVATLETMVLSAPSTDESRYVRLRVYSRVQGTIGVFGSLLAAKAALGSAAPSEQATTVTATAGTGSQPASSHAERIVRIAAGRNSGGLGAGKRTRVVLKPVGARRPHLLQALARKRIARAGGVVR